ncbi:MULTISPECIES: hypothetical protein [Bacillus cereus group]|uniref:Lipoprotein n=1 Tax=Bacillus cereus VD118 TaxID=1053231 RepID=R8Q7S8_BACCE|nr:MULTISPECIES: hypothetical protein [Bacillus cereus group]EOP67145.1 hypothetical protein IIQ_05411 [Bacillus cereus VD118]MBJ8096343.1 hypothetical protein [Bacillus cereus]MCQ6360556.1 hypothetical protein [Bacillus cereus]CAH2466349.1 hypothetical protein ACOSJ1_EBGNOMHC_05824 [Bacillus mycoides KBAB4]
MKDLKRQTVKILLASGLAFSMSACSGQNEPVSKEQQQTPTKKSVKKNESVNLPVTIFKDSKYEVEMQKVGFTRSITSVEMKDFDQTSELNFWDRYKSYEKRKNIKLKDDYKLLIINMTHETDRKARSHPLEAYMFNKGSGLVIGDEELAIKNEFLDYQQQIITTVYNVGRNLKEKGDIQLAIPNEYAKNKRLQLKLVQKFDGENKLVYIDLN